MPKTIMIVDDNPDSLELLGEMLLVKGYTVFQFPDGPSALRAAFKNPPDLILLDIMMSEMDGFQVCKELKSEKQLQSIPVIFISALDETFNIIRAFSEGGVDYITKPFKEEEVIARVKTHLQILSLQQQLVVQNERLEALVEKRTQQLAHAHERLQELSRLKNSFLSMISHEIRTPINGLLGSGELLLSLCPSSESKVFYEELFRKSSDRIHALIDDATMIMDLEQSFPESEVELSLSELLDDWTQAFPQIKVSMDSARKPELVKVQIIPSLMKKAIGTMMSLVRCFSSEDTSLLLKVLVTEDQCIMKMNLDTFILTAPQAKEFFDIESNIRSTSCAQTLGLSPVVAQRIIQFFGGNVRILKGEGDQGHLELTLPKKEGS